MHKDIMMQMADGTERSMSFVANGATAIRYRMVFGRELMEGITNIMNKIGADKVMGMMKEMAAKGDENGEVSISDLDAETMKIMVAIVGSGEMNTASQLAYIMNAAAEGKNMRTLDEDSWLDWLEQFEPAELLRHTMDFISLYISNKSTSSTPKKNGDRLIDL